jgi:hypothetical protein
MVAVQAAGFNAFLTNTYFLWSCDCPSFSYVCNWNMVYSAGENSELHLLLNTQTRKHLGDARYHGQYGSKHVTPSELRKQSKEVSISWVQTIAVRALEQIKRTGTKPVDEHYTEGKSTCTELSKLPCLQLIHQITKFCVLTQHTTVQWHTVPWLHTALIFCAKEFRPCRYSSHSSNTMVKGEVVPMYTMKTFRGSTVTAALICNHGTK